MKFHFYKERNITMKTLNEIKNNMQFGDIFTTEYFAEMVK